MVENKTFSEKVLEFNKQLSQSSISMPEGFSLINPFKESQKNQVNKLVVSFYSHYYNDELPRKMILGSSPARRGTAVTGVPFEELDHLNELGGLNIKGFSANRSSSDFLQNVIVNYGGREKFYSDFYMGFVCPLGITKTNSKGKEVNYNYYESKRIEEVLYPLILKSIEEQLNFGIDQSTGYCIGSGENFKFLNRINKKYQFFEEIIPLEHPRFITQYNSKRKDYFMDKYLKAFSKRGRE
ncbi:hypothetical protein A5886_002210 [Enterococcus sp. 8G7_MSG3316]|uniref:Uracil-DNA glycosylase-like domain-containing protein n=1 Tax=Candidatus Enterococcus testudinis TaxID=1834191 RepID=A0A242A8B5_9ENTE|nr:uracil-DNA glycosylase family protein [Enterococcus sp. 8G7_MSG3316]OTN77130.1 hypothetical protein A5886_002210 [Enterococcus sp. 8G7_MSG3316]